jgi:hypothetical protein
MATKKQTTGALAARYLDLLSEEGYRPKVEQIGERTSRLAFKEEGRKYVLLVDEDDEAFFALGLAYGVGEIDAAAATSRANEVNDQLKVVKAIVSAQDGCVRFLVEVFLEAPATMPLVERLDVGAP